MLEIQALGLCNGHDYDQDALACMDPRRLLMDPHDGCRRRSVTSCLEKLPEASCIITLDGSRYINASEPMSWCGGQSPELDHRVSTAQADNYFLCYSTISHGSVDEAGLAQSGEGPWGGVGACEGPSILPS